MEIQDRLFSENSGEVLYSLRMTESEYSLYSMFREELYSSDNKKNKSSLGKDAALVAGGSLAGAGAGAIIGKALHDEDLTSKLLDKAKSSDGFGKPIGNIAADLITHKGNNDLLKKAEAEIAANPHGVFEFDGKKNLTADQYLRRVKKAGRRQKYLVSEITKSIGDKSEKKIAKAIEAKRALKHMKKGALAGAGLAGTAVAVKHMFKDN